MSEASLMTIINFSGMLTYSLAWRSWSRWSAWCWGRGGPGCRRCSPSSSSAASCSRPTGPGGPASPTPGGRRRPVRRWVLKAWRRALQGQVFFSLVLNYVFLEETLLGIFRLKVFQWKSTEDYSYCCTECAISTHFAVWSMISKWIIEEVGKRRRGTLSKVHRKIIFSEKW